MKKIIFLSSIIIFIIIIIKLSMGWVMGRVGKYEYTN